MTWLLITIIAYFFNAIATVVDKTMLKKNVLSPISYTVSIAALGVVLILFIVPFGFSAPNVLTLIIALIAGAVFIWALILMFKALNEDEASRINAMIGGLTPVFIFILAGYVLQEMLTLRQLSAFIFLISGAFLISLDFGEHSIWLWFKKKLGLARQINLPHIRQALWLALPASLLFAVANTLIKHVYQNTDFLSGFVWTRLGSLLAVASLLLSAKNRATIKKDFKRQKGHPKQSKAITLRFLFGQACGGAGAILIQYAIFLGSVTLVNALQGLQQALVFIIAIVLSLTFPKLLREKISRPVLIQKGLAILLIGAGLYLVAI